MSYILGARCTDGVVMIADQKTSCEGTPSYNEEKIVEILPGIIVGGSGMVGFIERILDDVRDKFEYEEFNPNLVVEFIEQRCVEMIKKYDKVKEDFGFLVALNTNVSKLYSIDGEHGFADPIKRYTGIGSGEPHGSLLNEKLWKPDMSMLEYAKIGYFLVKFVINTKADDGVGGEPIVWFLPDGDATHLTGSCRKATPDEIKIMEEYANNKLIIINKCIEDLRK